jgi:hypothetical protein
MRVVAAGLTVGWARDSMVCAPYLPPTAVPAVQSPELESFRTASRRTSTGPSPIGRKP